MPVYTYPGCTVCCGPPTTGTGTGTIAGPRGCARLPDVLVAEIDALLATGTSSAPGTGDCDCLAGIVNLNRAGSGLNSWGNPSIGVCVAPVNATLLCTDNGDTTVTLTLQLTCSADNSGSASLIVAEDDLYTLDVTFLVLMEVIGGPYGTCTFQWNEMAMSWTQISSDCTNGGSCADPFTLPPGTVDGEILVVDCSPPAMTICCRGYVAVRVML